MKRLFHLKKVSLMLICLLIGITGTLAQNKVSLNHTNIKLLDIIKEIEASTTYRFVYNKSELERFIVKEISINKASVSKALKSLENQLPVAFLIKNKTISIRVKNASSQEESRGDQLGINNANVRQRSLSGTVSDERSGEFLIGATVYLKDSDLGTVTDISGNFYLNYPEGENILVISYVGYETKEIPITDQQTIYITLRPSSTTIDEVIVIGYTEKKIKDLTGSVGVVKLDDVKNQPVRSIEQVLQGRVAGTQVTSDGAPGGGISVRIRGYGTIGNNEPLYIIDGVPTKSDLNAFTQSGLTQFNTNDIASIQVLKDAAATAIYGARAANGVVIITTKKGNYKGEQKITFDTYVGLQQATNLPEMLNTQQYADLLWQAQKNAGLIPSNDVFGSNVDAPVIPEFIDGAQIIPASLPGTDWFDELFQTALMQSYNVGYQSGNERSRMAFSASYFNQEGIMQYTGFDRYTLRSNTEFKTKNDLVKIGQNISFSYSDVTSVPTNAALGSRIIHAYRMNPIVSLRDINGDWASSVKGVQGAENPVALNFFDQNDSRVSSRIFGNVYTIIEPIKNLVFKSDFGLDYEIFNLKNYSPRFEMGDAVRAVNSFSQINLNTLNWVWNNTLRYDFTYNAHSISTLIGTEAIRFTQDEFGASRDNFFTDDINYVYLDSGEGQQTNSGGGTQWALFSIFGRIDYAFANKYLLGVSVRRDGSSRFSAGNRYAVFPAFSVGWRVSEEAFLQKTDWLSDLKLRFSWGESGNQEIGDFASFSSFATSSNDANYDLNGTNSNAVTGFKANRLGNPNIVWETTTQTNFGIDLSLFDYRLRLSGDYFVKNTDDILLQRPTLAIEGQAEAPFVNAGSMENRGIELQLTYSGLPIGNFSYEISLNGTMVDNKVLELADDVEFIPGFVSNSSTRNLTISRTETGSPIAQLYGHVVEGIFNSQTEVQEHAEQPGKAIGRLKFSDLNNDGVIDEADRTIIGNPHPDLVYGLNLSARYKNLDLSIFLQGVQGVDLYNFTRYYTDFYFDLGNRHSRILDAWTASNPNATIPRISSVDTNNELRPSTYFVEDGSFLRLKNLQIGYTLFLDRNRTQRLRLYLQGNNLITFTNYEGLDPEVSLVSYSNRNRNLDLGVDRGVYPNSRIISFGANLEF